MFGPLSFKRVRVNLKLHRRGSDHNLVGGELDVVGGELDQVQSKWGQTRHGAKPAHTDRKTAVRLFSEISVKPSVSSPDSSLRLLRVLSEIPSNLAMLAQRKRLLRKKSS